MKYIRFNINTGYCGMGYVEYMEFDDETTEELIDEYCAEMARENANAYGLESEEDEERAMEYSSARFVSKEEYDANT